MIIMSMFATSSRWSGDLLRRLVASSQCREYSQQAPHRSKSIRVLLVGSGRMGNIRASILHANPRIDLMGIVDPIVGGPSAELSERYQVPCFPTVTEAMDRFAPRQQESTAGVDALVVSSPTSSRTQIIQEAAHHGLAVFTEKPVGETAQQIQKLFDTAQTANIALCCGFQRRFDPSYQAATQAVWNGDIGAPVAVHMVFADHPVPPMEFLLTGGDIFMDLLAHDVDYITHTLSMGRSNNMDSGKEDDGAAVLSVYAVATSSDPYLAAAGIHDNATVVLTFQGGVVATLFLSRSATYGYDQRCEIFGTLGLVSVGNVHECTTVLSNQSGIHHARLQHSFPERFEKAFAQELDAFCDTLLLGKPWSVTRNQCIRVQQIADAARCSAKTGTVIQLHDEPNLGNPRRCL